MLRSLGVPISEEGCRETMGLRIDKVVALWFERCPWRGMSIPEAAAAIVKGVIRLIQDEGRPMPGAIEALNLFGAMGVPVAIASSSSPALIEAAIKRLGIASLISLFHSAELEEWGKPHPAVYLTTCRLLGVEPHTAVAVEDSPRGLESARSAGLISICVPDSSTDKSLFGETDLMLSSLLELKNETLAEVWSRVRMRPCVGTDCCAPALHVSGKTAQ